MEMDRARTRSLSATAVLAALLAVLALGALAGPVSAAVPQGVAAEEAVEADEDAEEQAEDASTLAAFGAPTAHLTLLEAKLFAVYTRHIEYLRGQIVHIRESKRVDQTLPHTTTRWLVHVPKKRAHIKELRTRLHELRVLRAHLLGS